MVGHWVWLALIVALFGVASREVRGGIARLARQWGTLAPADGFGAIALLARTGVSGTNPGEGMEFDVLAAVVLGGTTFAGGRGGVGGTFAGVLVLFIALNLANVAGLPFAAQLAIKGLIIIAASAAHSWLGRRGSGRSET